MVVAPVVDADELHLTSVRAEPRRHLFDRPPDPGPDVERVQVMQQQQALHQRVGDQGVHQPPAALGVLADDLDDLG